MYPVTLYPQLSEDICQCPDLNPGDLSSFLVINPTIVHQATATLDHVMQSYFSDGIVAKSQGSTSWNSMFSILPCKDGFIQISLFYQWETLVEWLDDEGLAGDLTDKKWQEEDNERSCRRIPK